MLKPFALAEGSTPLERQLAMILLAGELLPPDQEAIDRPDVEAGSSTQPAPNAAPATGSQKLRDAVRLQVQRLQTILSLAKAISLPQLRELWRLLVPVQLSHAMTAAVRPVIWHDQDYPGFRGTCFLVRAFGSTFAITARHVLGSERPTNMAVPRSCESGQMHLLQPKNIFWYNGGDHDHVADLAIAVLGDDGDTPLNTMKVGFTNPVPGEAVVIPGFPLQQSEVHYGVGDQAQPIRLEDGSFLNHVFVWNPIVARGRCKSSATPATLGTLEFEEGSSCADPDGMSGAPVFVVRKGKLAIAGMLVRAGIKQGHFVGGEAIGLHVMRVAAKEPGVMIGALEVIRVAELMEGSGPGTFAARVFADVGGFVGGVGDPAVVQATLDAWLRGSGPLAQLALARFSNAKVQKDCGEEAAEVLQSLRTYANERARSPR